MPSTPSAHRTTHGLASVCFTVVKKQHSHEKIMMQHIPDECAMLAHAVVANPDKTVWAMIRIKRGHYSMERAVCKECFRRLWNGDYFDITVLACKEEVPL